jgi:hypothetical protein
MKQLSPVVYVILFVAILATVLLRESHPEQIPTVFISLIAVWFSYCAYKFSKEKFRLDLMDKRWEIYEQVLKFCSVVIKHGGLPEYSADEDTNKSVVSALKAAHESFRGVGLHKAKALFGPEIHEKFKKLDEMYSWFIAKPRDEGWAQKESQHLEETWNLLNELPELFKPYMYFGDYKNS